MSNINGLIPDINSLLLALIADRMNWRARHTETNRHFRRNRHIAEFLSQLFGNELLLLVVAVKPLFLP
ncbi:MAG TPA: hypothetical protein VIM41_15770 [Gammaproteobacteria bacterium]